MDLSVEDIIDFLIFLEKNGISEERELFLHNQYMRLLLKKQGCNIGILPVENGNIGYYNLKNLESKLDNLKKYHMNMGKYMMIHNIESQIEVLKEPYLEHRVLESLGRLKGKDLSNIINIIKLYKDLIITNNDILYSSFNDIIFKKNDKMILPTIKKLAIGWSKNDYTLKCVCGGNIYIYNFEVFPFSMELQYKGYCPVCNLYNESKINIHNARWVNI